MRRMKPASRVYPGGVKSCVYSSIRVGVFLGTGAFFNTSKIPDIECEPHQEFLILGYLGTHWMAFLRIF